MVMTAVRKLGSSGLPTPGSLSIGFRTAPMPPSRLTPWQLVQFCKYSVAPREGSPGSAVLPGEAAASVLIAVSARMAGTAMATTAGQLKPLTRLIREDD